MAGVAVNRDALYGPLKAYTQRAVEELSSACPDDPPHVLTGFREWRRRDENIFELRDREEPAWEWCILQTRDLRHGWPEYAAVEAAIRTDPLLSGQIETLVGTAFGAHRQEGEHIADAPLWALGRQHDGFAF